MLSWLKKLLLGDRETINAASLAQVTKPVAPQECQRTREASQRIGKAFDEQRNEMQMRSMKPHDSKCKDVWNCTKKNCFKSKPDKIVKEEVVDMTPKQVAVAKKNKEILKGI